MKPSVPAGVIAMLIGLHTTGALLAQAPQQLASVPLAPAVEVECLEVLRGALKSDQFWPTMHAAEALTLAGETDEVRAALAALLPNEHDDQRRCGLAHELARAGDRDQLALLEQILADADSTGRVHAAESLYKLGETGMGDVLRAAYRQDANRPLKLWATAALARSGDEACLAELRVALRSDQPGSRATAAFALSQLGDSGDVEPLASALATETDSLTRVMLAGALACREHAGGRAQLGRQLASTNVTARAIAADFVGTSRCVEFQPLLVALLKDDALDVRVRAAQSLIALSQPVVGAQSR